MRYNVAETGTNRMIQDGVESTCAPVVGDYYSHDGFIYIVRKRIWHDPNNTITCVVERTDL